MEASKYFWFSKPHLILHLIHFVLFQNAFQITYFFWIWYEYKIGSCFHDNIKLVIAKLIIGVGVLILCSYITLPLYALVSQMGSNMKKSIFDEQTSKALKNWRMAAVKKKRGGGSVSGSSPTAARTAAHSPSSRGYGGADSSRIHLTLARLLQGFDLSTPMGKPVDMSEGLGIALPKVKPLEVAITPRLSPEL